MDRERLPLAGRRLGLSRRVSLVPLLGVIVHVRLLHVAGLVPEMVCLLHRAHHLKLQLVGLLHERQYLAANGGHRKRPCKLAQLLWLLYFRFRLVEGGV